MMYRKRWCRAVGWCWLIGSLPLAGCVGPKRAGPFGVAYAVDDHRVKVHYVAPGETLYAVARQYGVSASSLADFNDINEPHLLQIGQELRVPINALVATQPESASASTPVVATVASLGTAVPLALVVAPAALTSPNAAEAASPNTIVAEAPSKPAKPQPTAIKLAEALRSGRSAVKQGSHGPLNLQWPVAGKVTSHFGRRNGRPHDGIDIGAPVGSQVRAAADGDVVFADTHRGYGNVVILRHADGLMTIYAHHQKNLVAAGQRVKQGEPIAHVGSTGRASGPHLHFEVRRRAQPHDPLRFLPRLAS